MTQPSPSYGTLKSLFVFLVLAFSFTLMFAQTVEDDEFSASLLTVVNSRPDAFKDLETLFKDFKSDSLKMKQLQTTSNSLNYLSGESYALIALGNIYRNISKYDDAIKAHMTAEQLALEADNLSLRIISLNMLGVDYRRMDFLRSALDYHSQAYVLTSTALDKTEDIKRSRAVSLNSMGNIYLALQQYDLALTQFNKSLALEKEANSKLGLAINYHNIGYAKEGKGLFDDALEDYETSLSYNEQIDSEVGRAICLNSIGNIYIKKGLHADALPYIEKGLEKALLTKDQFYISSSYATLGWAQLKLNRLDEAERSLNKAIDIAESYTFKSTEVEARKYLSELSEKKGNHIEALQHFKEATAIEKTITNEHNLNYVNDLVIKYESDSKTNTIKALTNENEIVRSRLEKIKLFSIIGTALLLLTAIFLIIFNRHSKLRQETKILTLEQDMLRSQMNPHFIFNSLNSIKLYIINNEKENAVYYLNKFAKLIRKILVASSEKDIQLSDELETMALYMNIENIRFSNEIDFQIHIDDSVNAESIRVPSLILQPFLENALWHGLSSKKDDKRITIDVRQEDEKFVRITITDNGVGRKASKAIKDNKTLKRKSVGIALTKERLENFSKGFNANYKLDIQDLYDENNNAMGTRVVIDIPIRSFVLESA